MNITIISNHYYPEDSGIGLYSTGMAEFLAKKHIVKVIAATPYYPQWKIYPEYDKKGLFSTEIVNDVEIFRFKQFTPAIPTFKGRIFQMIHFFIGSFINIFKIKKNDIVIVVMPFTISAILGWLVKTFRGGKLWIHVQDFEFDAAFETGISKKIGILPSVVFKIELFMFNRADFTSTISNGMLNKLESKTNTKKYFFPNWIDHSMINTDRAKPSPLFDSSKFNVLYSGNIGAKQDWDFFVDFVSACQEMNHVQIYLIGEGAKRKEVVESLKQFQNCKYYPPVRYEELNDLLCNADLHVLFQKNAVVDTVMPSKILGMMASAKPSIVTGNEYSEVRHNLEISEGGFYFHQDTKLHEIMGVLKNLIENPEQSTIMGDKARKFVIEKYSIESVLSQFQKDIENS
ncbi:glycosyltransferase [Flavobacterium xinjiangense]|uniref:Colanic acid biosynthesis glycosyl transferase WcaI n=1 Tax=Flavobacterium xinjiangense TaxID=178356 RepID=A0A1M7MEC8_9FLAO|nr:glycosyltransferase [Flavobacterium xinjiangense]SHM88704.1 colanic acid biosynthesis glycosyl transferase WcaI [Flavobacterium xinjiangense]